jgi:hypothetical protein
MPLSGIIGSCGSGLLANVQTTMPNAGTISNLYVSASPAPGTGQSWTIWLEKNGANTALTCGISNTSTTCSDTVDNVTYAAGDIMALKINGSASPSSSWISFSEKLVGQ